MPVEKSYIDTYRVKNITKRTITLGDLVNVVILPGKTVDLLKQPMVTKEKINQSKNLQMAVNSGWLVILNLPLQGKTKAEKKAILAWEIVGTENQTTGGSGSSVIGTDDDARILAWLLSS